MVRFCRLLGTQGQGEVARRWSVAPRVAMQKKALLAPPDNPLVLPFLPTGRGHMGKTRLAYGRGTGKPHPVDVHVGARVRMRRTLLGMSQTTLGDVLGVAFQQVQRYERGTNRIGSSRLFDLSRVLGVPVEFFFEEMSAEVAAISPAQRRRKAKEPSSYELGPTAKRETLKLVRAYYKIEDANVRKRLRELTMAIGAGASSSE